MPIIAKYTPILTGTRDELRYLSNTIAKQRFYLSYHQ